MTILAPDDMPGGWADSIARRDAEFDALCVTCGYWLATDGDQCGFCADDEARANAAAARGFYREAVA